MSEWSYAANDPATVKAYSQFVFNDGIQACIGYKLALGMGPRRKDSPDNIVQMLDELQQGPGRQVQVDLIGKLSGRGTTGDNEAGPNAEGLKTFQDTLTIDQLRHVVNPSGAMSQQSVHWSMREQARKALGDWWRERWDTIVCNQLTGNSLQTDTAYTGNNACLLPDSAHVIIANGKDCESTGGTLGANTGTVAAPLVIGDIFTFDLIGKAVTRMNTLARPIKPLRLKGMEVRAVALLHPLQVKSLRNNFGDGQWATVQQAAIQGGEITGNPIFNGALGMIDNVILFEVPRIPYGTVAQSTDANGDARYNPLGIGTATAAGAPAQGVARAVVWGAQARGWAFGRAYGSDQRLKWVEEAYDGFNKILMFAGCIFGVKKLRFKGMDFGTVTISSFELE